MEELKWVDATDGQIPENAVEGGNEGDVVLYVGRASAFGDVVPGKVIEGQGCFISYGCAEHNIPEYQVLVNDTGVTLEWVPAEEGSIPDDAVPGGNTLDEEFLYVGRGEHDGNLICGKIHPSHGCLYVPHCQGEHSVKEYEVLICKSNE